MPTLKDILLVPGQRPRVIADCVQVIDEEVKDKSGLTGLAIKGAYAVVKAIKPGFISESVDHMLDDFTTRLDPIYADGVAKGQPIAAYFESRRGDVAEALLGISDDRASKSTNGTIKKAYEKLRPTAKKHVETAVPRIGRLVEKYASAATAVPTPPQT